MEQTAEDALKERFENVFWGKWQKDPPETLSSRKPKRALKHDRTNVYLPVNDVYKLTESQKLLNGDATITRTAYVIYIIRLQPLICLRQDLCNKTRAKSF